MREMKGGGAPKPVRRLRPIVMAVFAVIALGLLVLAAINQGDAFLEAVAGFEASSIALCIAFGIIATIANSLAWRASMAALGADLPFAASLRVYFVSQLGKYVPGSVWPLLAQVELARDAGVPRARSSAGSLLGMVVGATTSAVIGASLLVLGRPQALVDYWFVLVVVALGALALTPPVLSWGLRLVSRMLRRDSGHLAVRPGALMASIAWSGVMWLAFGAHMYSLVPAADLLTATGAYALAWLAGFVMILAPAGVGVREGALVIAFGGVLEPSQALAAALVSRLVLTLIDGAAGGVAFLLRSRRRPDPRVSGPGTSQ